MLVLVLVQAAVRAHLDGGLRQLTFEDLSAGPGPQDENEGAKLATLAAACAALQVLSPRPLSLLYIENTSVHRKGV